MKTLGISYIRVSSKAQVDEGVSLEVQEERNYNLLKDHKCEKIMTFRDEGKSATKIKGRDEFIKAVNYAIEKKANYFCVYDTSRFARNAEEALMVYKKLNLNGIKFICCTGKFEDSPEGKLVFTMMSGIDEYTSAKQGQKIKESMDKLKSKGRFPHCAPPGYKNIRHEDGKSDIKLLVKDKELLQLALKKFIQREIKTKKDFGYFLFQNNFTHKWTQSHVKNPDKLGSRILKNPFYAGYFNYKDKLVKHVYEAVYTLEEFETIQGIMTNRVNNNNGPRRKENPNFPLRKLTTCAICNSKLRGYRCTGNGGHYYVYDCKTKGCDKSQQAEDVHKEFTTYLNQFKMQKEDVKLFKEILKRVIGKEMEGGESETKRMKALLVKLKQEQEGI